MTEMRVPRTFPRKNRTTTPGEEDGDHQLLHHVVHEEPDEGGVVVGHVELQAWESPAWISFELGLDPLDDL